MTVELGPEYDVSFTGVPAHMSTEDYALWIRYRPVITPARPLLYFDVALGGERAAEAKAPKDFERMWWRLNAKRIDVLAVYADRVDIIELRNAAQANAVGRLLMYKQLWDAEPAFPQPARMVLVTDSADPDVVSLAQQQGIEYVQLVPVPYGR